MLELRKVYGYFIGEKPGEYKRAHIMTTLKQFKKQKRKILKELSRLQLTIIGKRINLTNDIKLHGLAEVCNGNRELHYKHSKACLYPLAWIDPYYRHQKIDVLNTELRYINANITNLRKMLKDMDVSPYEDYDHDPAVVNTTPATPESTNAESVNCTDDEIFVLTVDQLRSVVITIGGIMRYAIVIAPGSYSRILIEQATSEFGAKRPHSSMLLDDLMLTCLSDAGVSYEFMCDMPKLKISQTSVEEDATVELVTSGITHSIVRYIVKGTAGNKLLHERILELNSIKETPKTIDAINTLILIMLNLHGTGCKNWIDEFIIHAEDIIHDYRADRKQDSTEPAHHDDALGKQLLEALATAEENPDNMSTNPYYTTQVYLSKAGDELMVYTVFDDHRQAYKSYQLNLSNPDVIDEYNSSLESIISCRTIETPEQLCDILVSVAEDQNIVLSSGFRVFMNYQMHVRNSSNAMVVDIVNSVTDELIHTFTVPGNHDAMDWFEKFRTVDSFTNTLPAEIRFMFSDMVINWILDEKCKQQ